jgi:NAD(P)H-nitrite reductase large subunit
MTLTPGELVLGAKNAPSGVDSLPDDAQICSCNNVSKAMIKSAVRNKECKSIGEVKSCTKAGMGCGGCIPEVTEIFKSELKAVGGTVTNHLCEHFAYSRVDLCEIVKVMKFKDFNSVLKSHGKGFGCEICKPTIASILASLYGEHILNKSIATLQDTNDRYLANIQRGGSYSVIPRIPGGEITPQKLIVIGEVAKKHGLYTKITGGQRIDLLGYFLLF